MINVLIVENDDHVLHSLEVMFRAEGFDIHSTWSAREALRLLELHEFRAVLLGDYLPDLHYGEFMKRAIRHSGNPYVVLTRTRRAPASELRRDRALGFSAEVDKADLKQIRQTVVDGLTRTLASNQAIRMGDSNQRGRRASSTA
jgi:DNA-binding response OmpR family regulator